MLKRISMVLAGCLASLSLAELRADLLGTDVDPQTNASFSEIVNKNADVRNAIAAFERGDIQECERLLAQALKGEKDLPAVNVMVARMLMGRGQLNESLSRLELHLQKGNKDPEAHVTMGEIAMMSGRNTDAWLHFREAQNLMTATNYGKAKKEALTNRLLRLRAEVAERRQDIDTALGLYRELEQALPKSGYPLVAQARILIGNADITRGVDLLRRAKKIDPNTPQPELQIALALSSSKDVKETEKWFQDGIRQTETATVANWVEYLKWLLAQDRPEEVQYFVQRAPAKYQSERSMRLLDAMAMRFLGKNEEAEKAFSVLLSEDTSDMMAADQLALLLVESLDTTKNVRAQQLSQSNLRRAPNEEFAIATAAWVSFKMAAPDVADQYFNSLIARGTSNPQVVYYVARILEKQGRQDEAMALYQTAVELPGLFVQRREVSERLKGKGNSANKDSKAKSGNVAPSINDSKAQAKEEKGGSSSPKTENKDATKSPAKGK